MENDTYLYPQSVVYAREQQELVELCAKGCRELIQKEKDILGEVL